MADVKSLFLGMGSMRDGLKEWPMPPPDLLPNHELAVVPPAKLAGYALNPDHELGRHKARVFAAVLGIGPAQAAALEAAIRQGLRQVEAKTGSVDRHGQRYSVDLPVTGPTGTAMVRTCWIVREDSGAPHLTSVYVKEDDRWVNR